MGAKCKGEGKEEGKLDSPNLAWKIPKKDYPVAEPCDVLSPFASLFAINKLIFILYFQVY
jgi:hypothetical protein